MELMVKNFIPLHELSRSLRDGAKIELKNLGNSEKNALLDKVADIVRKLADETLVKCQDLIRQRGGTYAESSRRRDRTIFWSSLDSEYPGLLHSKLLRRNAGAPSSLVTDAPSLTSSAPTFQSLRSISTADAPILRGQRTLIVEVEKDSSDLEKLLETDKKTAPSLDTREDSIRSIGARSLRTNLTARPHYEPPVSEKVDDEEDERLSHKPIAEDEFIERDLHISIAERMVSQANIGKYPNPEPYAAVIDELVQILIKSTMDIARSHANSQQVSSAGLVYQYVDQAGLGASASAPLTNKAHKPIRKRRREDDDDDDGDKRLTPNSPQSAESNDPKAAPRYPCPFRQRNPGRFNITEHPLCSMSSYEGTNLWPVK